MRQRRLRFWDRSFRGRSVYPALRGKQSALRIFSGHFPFCGAWASFSFCACQESFEAELSVEAAEAADVAKVPKAADSVEAPCWDFFSR